MEHERSSIDISSLQVGQEYKSLQELSLVVLGEKLPSGKGRRNRIKKMQQFFSWDKKPGSHKVVITEVFNQRRKPLDPRSKYAPLIYEALFNYPKELVFTKTELLHVLNIVNDKFNSKEFITAANTLKIKYKPLKIIITDMYTQLNNIVMRALKQLESSGYINIEETKKIIYKTNSTKEVTVEEINKIYKEKQHELSCKSYFDVIKNNLVNEYTTLCKIELSKLGITKVINLYKITLLRTLEITPGEETLNSLCRSYLFNHYSENLIAKKVINYYTSLSPESL